VSVSRRCAETFILAKSRDRARKKKPLHRRFVERIEAGLTAIAAAAASGRLKDPEKAGRRIRQAAGARTARGFRGCFQSAQVKSYSRRKAGRAAANRVERNTAAWQQWCAA